MQSPEDIESRISLEQYFGEAPGTFTEKLEAFPKFVPRQALARFLARYELFNLVRDVHGSIVECGVFNGAGLFTFAKVSAILEPYNYQRQVIGFDTFSGFTDLHAEDRSGLDVRRSPQLRQGGYRAGSLSDLDRATAIFDMSRYLGHIPKVQLIAGDFRRTGPEYIDANPQLIISCLYLDFDLYEPTRLALELFLPRVPRGGVVVFDELNDPAFPGESAAALEGGAIRNLRLRRFSFDPKISYAVID